MPPRRRPTGKKATASKPARRSTRRGVKSSPRDSVECGEGADNVASTEVAAVEVEAEATGGAFSGEIVTIKDNGDRADGDIIVEHDKTEANVSDGSMLRSFLDSEGIARLGEILHNVLGQNSCLISVDVEEEKSFEDAVMVDEMRGTEDLGICVSESGVDHKGAEPELVEEEPAIVKNEEKESAGDFDESFRARENGYEKVDGGDDVKVSEVHMGGLYTVQEGGDYTREITGGEKGVMESQGHVGDFAKAKEGGDEEIESMVDKDEEDNAVMESFVNADGFSGAKEGAHAERKNTDDVNKKYNAVVESLGQTDGFPGGQEDIDEEEESIDKEDEADDVVMEATGNEDGLFEAGEVGEKEEKSSDDVNNEDNQDIESPGHMKYITEVQEGGDKDGKSIDNEDEEDVAVMESNGNRVGIHGVQEDGEQEETSLEDVEDGVGDEEECDVGGMSSDDREDDEGNEDSEEVRTVYVKGLTKSWNVEKLEKTLKQYGEIENVTLPRKFGAKHQDFGFIAFTSRESALSCVEGINNGPYGGVETKVKAELAKPKSRGRTKIRESKDHVRSKVAKTLGERTDQTHKKSFLSGRKGKTVAKEALSESKSGKEGKPNNNKGAISKGQNASSGKMDRKRKNFHLEPCNRGKRNMVSNHDNRPSEKFRGNARDKQSKTNSRRKPQYGQRLVHGAEYNDFGRTASTTSYPYQVQSPASGSKRHHLDMAPHAGYIEPAMRKQARHYVGYIDSHVHQRESHASYYEPAFRDNGCHLTQYLKPNLGREALPHAGLLESTVGKHGSAAYDHSLMRIGGHDGQGSQRYLYWEGHDRSAVTAGSIVSPSHAPNYSSYVGYQAGNSYRHSYGAYLPQRNYY